MLRSIRPDEIGYLIWNVTTHKCFDISGYRFQNFTSGNQANRPPELNLITRHVSKVDYKMQKERPENAYVALSPQGAPLPRHCAALRRAAPCRVARNKQEQEKNASKDGKEICKLCLLTYTQPRISLLLKHSSQPTTNRQRKGGRTPLSGHLRLLWGGASCTCSLARGVYFLLPTPSSLGRERNSGVGAHLFDVFSGPKTYWRLEATRSPQFMSALTRYSHLSP